MAVCPHGKTDADWLEKNILNKFWEEMYLLWKSLL